MTPTNPYLLRAIYQWVLDNDCTPHLLVDATAEHVVVPESGIRDGSIVLNVAPGAVRDLDIGDDFVLFGARFGGAPFDVTVPVSAVRAIYAKENGQGIVLPQDTGAHVDGGGASSSGAPPAVPHLKVVK